LLFVPKEGDLAMNLVATFDKVHNDDDVAVVVIDDVSAKQHSPHHELWLQG